MTGFLRRRLAVAALCCGLAFSSVQFLKAAAPTLDHLYPSGGQQGTNLTVSAIGKLEPWPVEVWTDTPGLVFKADKDKGKFLVQIAADVPAGPHLVRTYNADGASVPRFFLVNRHAEVIEDEGKNNSSDTAQVIEKLPAIVNGKLERGGDVDCFAMKLEAGQWLIASLNAFTIYSPMDGLLRVTDTNGTKLAFAHDSDTLDPFLAWQAKTNGTYVVQVMGFAHPATASENLGGGANYVYRLSLTSGPYVQYAMPSSVQRGKKGQLQLVGWNLGKNSRSMDVPIDAASLKQEQDEVLLNIKEVFNNLPVPLSDEPATKEKEPNDKPEQAQKLTVPCSVHGVFQTPGDEDRYSFDAKKDEKFQFDIESISPGTPLDAWVRVTDSTGKEVAKSGEREGGRRRRSEGSGSDSKLAWTASADGSYVVATGNVLRKGGDNYAYRLEITRPQPGFSIKAPTHTFSITPGKTNEIKATVRLINGFDHKLKLSAKNLPAEITADVVDVPEKGGDVTLKLVASTNAAPFNGLFQLIITDTKTSTDQIVPADLTSGGIDNGVPQGFPTLVMDQTDKLWLTVLPKAAPKEEKKEEKK